MVVLEICYACQKVVYMHLQQHRYLEEKLNVVKDVETSVISFY